MGLESAAMNLPIIVPKIVGFQEQIQNGNFGFLYSPQSCQKEAEQIKKILINNFETLIKLGENGRDFVLKSHDIQKQKIKYRIFLESMMV